jgi:hypothetical protein
VAPEDLTVTDIDGLMPHHRQLVEASAIDVGVATEAGVRSVTSPGQLPDGLRWLGRHRGALPGLVFLWTGIDGRDVPQYRPDEPVALTEGDIRKYLWPTGADLVVWVHPRMACLELTDVTELVVVEGTKQYLAAVSAAGPGRLVVGISGCSGWLGDGVPLPELAELPVAGRRVVVIFDADLAANRAVWNAGDALGRHLGALGATEVVYVRLPAGRKAGLDDYLASMPAAQRPEVFDRLVARADGIGRAPARARRASVGSIPQEFNNNNSPEEELDSFDDVRDEPGHRVLDDLVGFVRRFVAFTNPQQADAVALFVVHTYAVNVADSTPRLSVQSPEKRSGKTRLLELVELLARRAYLAASVSSSALFRLIEAHQATVLIDEADTIFARTRNGDPRNEDLRGLVNAGHRRGAVVIRCVGEGAALTTKAFPVFGPVALAGIGQLPDTIHDRSIVIALRRRRPDETVESFRRRLHEAEARALARRVAAWVHRQHHQLAHHIPEMPTGLIDRTADAWEPLLAIADVAGGDWPTVARDAAIALSYTQAAGDETDGQRLLADIRAIFDNATSDRMWSATIVEKLNALDEAPWGGWHRGGGFATRDLARLLRGFDIRSRDVRVGETNRKGYYFADFEDAWSRYPTHAAAPSPGSATSATSATPQVAPTRDVADVADVAAHAGGVAVNDDTAAAETLDRLERGFGPLTDEDPDDYARRLNPGELGPIDRNDGTWF